MFHAGKHVLRASEDDVIWCQSCCGGEGGLVEVMDGGNWTLSTGLLTGEAMTE